jgi:hypothetical protein
VGEQKEERRKGTSIIELVIKKTQATQPKACTMILSIALHNPTKTNTLLSLSNHNKRHILYFVRDQIVFVHTPAHPYVPLASG